MIIRVADFNFSIKNHNKTTDEFCENFKCSSDTKVDAEFEITREDVQYEISQLTGNISQKLIDSCENVALYRKICAYALQNDAFVMHGAVIEYMGKGYVFLASSGTGKTTHIMLWKKCFGDEKVTIVNGDKPIIRLIDGKVYAYGTPWNGKERLGINGRVELCSICFLQRGAKNSIKRVTTDVAVPYLLSQLMIADSTNLAKQLELVDELTKKVPMYLLKCNISEEAATTAFEGMSKS